MHFNDNRIDFFILLSLGDTAAEHDRPSNLFSVSKLPIIGSVLLFTLFYLLVGQT